MTRKFSSSINYFLPFFLLFGIAITQYYSDIKKINPRLVPPTIIPAPAIKLVDLGLHSAISSLMWLRTIQEITTHPLALPRLIDNTTDIDPGFSYPYAFAALVLPPNGFPEEGIYLAEKGIERADKDWRIPYYLATSYHIFFSNREKAAFYFDMAANTPGVFENIRSIAARYGISSNREQTKQIWQAIYETSSDEIVAERAEKYLLHLEILDLLDEALLKYHRIYGKYPPSLDDLVTKKIIKAIPASPLGVKFGIRKDGEITVIQ